MGEVGLYADPLVYDVLHAPGTAREVDGLVRAADLFLRRGHKRARASGMTWLEPACGTGRYLRTLARRGHRVVGFDRSPGMIEFAGKRLASAVAAGRAHVFEAEMRDFARGWTRRVGEACRNADVAFIPINTIRHLESDEEMLEHIAQVASVLSPDGVYLVGISLAAYGMEWPTEDVWSGARGDLKVRQVVQYEPAPGTGRLGRFEKVHSVLTVSRGGREELHTSAYRLRAYDRQQWESLVGRSALRVVGVVDEAGEALEPREMGYGVWALGHR